MPRGGHECHAMKCSASVPPRLHMCARHWRMVPKHLQDRLWDAYSPGQERRMDPSSKYLLAAAACVRHVAEVEGYPMDEIDREIEPYVAWAEMVREEEQDG